jgi:hypothetical protein
MEGMPDILSESTRGRVMLLLAAAVAESVLASRYLGTQREES